MRPVSTTTGSITATCVTRTLRARTSVDATPTGIDKAPVAEVHLGPTGVVDDRVLDTEHHGGVDKAVYAYADEDADWWADRLGTAVPPGRFGENLRTSGIDLVGAVLGSRWRVGDDVELEVSEPRVPCATFQHHMDDRSGWVRDFTAAGRVGTYLRVRAGGRVAAGMPVRVVHVPDHGVTVGRWFRDADPADARALLAAATQGWSLAGALREQAGRVLARHADGPTPEPGRGPGAAPPGN